MTERGQITIPQEIREMEKMKANDKIFVIDIDGTIILTKPSSEKFMDIMKEVGKHVNYDEIKKSRREDTAKERKMV
jgi:AbrB family looped-hinge helix DNA binding protein